MPQHSPPAAPVLLLLLLCATALLLAALLALTTVRSRRRLFAAHAALSALTRSAADAAASLAALERRHADTAHELRSTRAMLAQARRLEAAGRLAGAAAHDLNNVLGVVANSVHLVERHAAAAPALLLPAQALQRAVDNGTRLVQLLQRFIDRQPTTAGTVDLARHLPDAVEPLQLLLGKRVSVQATVEHGTRCIHADPAELELVLIHLALNARAALAPGGHLWLDARNAAADDARGLPSGNWVVVGISDDGAGMSDETLARAFEPFHSTRPGSAGLGLAQVQRWAHDGGGEARIASTPGFGTAVSLLLPAAAGSANVDAGQAAQAQSGAEARLAGKRLLLVEDNDELAHVTAVLLGSYGCVVETARDPAEALELVDGDLPFDIVLSDVVMPGEIDGVALARRLAQRAPPLPVVLISGYSSALAGVADFTVLQKPCTPQQLLDALAAAITASR